MYKALGKMRKCFSVCEAFNTLFYSDLSFKELWRPAQETRMHSL